MDRLLSIGEFAKLTHLPVKTLRHYHEVGVLVPAAVDEASSYRRYSFDQVEDAHLVRRLRSLEMPLPEVRAALTAPDGPARNRTILTYLTRMDRELAEAQVAVQSLRALLEDGPGGPTVELVTVEPTPTLAIDATVARAGLGEWCEATFGLLFAAVARFGLVAAGPGGGLYSDEFFEADVGPVVAYLPLPEPADVVGRAHPLELPAATLATIVHPGPFEELDRAYGVLGRWVAGRSLRVAGPVRERYLVSPADSDDPHDLRTEVGWPIDAPADPADPSDPADRFDPPAPRTNGA